MLTLKREANWLTYNVLTDAENKIVNILLAAILANLKCRRMLRGCFVLILPTRGVIYGTCVH